MAYHMNLENMTIDDLENRLKHANLTKSRMLIKDDLERHFETIRKFAFKHAAEFQEALKSKAKLKAFSDESGIEENYLVILIREINSWIKKPNKMVDFTLISKEFIDIFVSSGMKTTLQVYNQLMEKDGPKKIKSLLGCTDDQLSFIISLIDLSRVRWVNHTFAEMLYETGFKSSKDVMMADWQDMYDKINVYNKEHEIYRGKIGENDMMLVIASAKDVPQDLIQ